MSDQTPLSPSQSSENSPVGATGLGGKSCCSGHVCWGSGAKHPHSHRLEVNDLAINYHKVQALDGVSFSTECGQALALIGPNGAGKSSLLKALAGLIKADRGTIAWRGQPLTNSSHELAYLPQRGDVDWDFPITVRGLVEMGRYPNLGWWRRYTTHDRDMVERALETMALQDLSHRQIRELSGGQQQRAFIARALAQEAHVLLLDEPFTGLDQTATELLQKLFRELAKEGRLLIASHHELDTAPLIFDQVLLLNRHTVAFGPTHEVLTPERLSQAFGKRLRLAAAA